MVDAPPRHEPIQTRWLGLSNPVLPERTPLDTLAALADELAGQFSLRPLLRRVLQSAAELLQCRSGSICLIDQAAGTHTTEIDLDEAHTTGQVYPLDEGITGAVARAGRTIMFDSYASVPRGHLTPDEERFDRAVIAAPIRLKANLLGACIVFAADSTLRFTRDDAQLLQLFATHASIAIANARLHTDAANRAARAAVAAERERSMMRIHDTVGRGLASALLKLERAHTLPGLLPEARAAIREAQVAAHQALDAGRRAVFGLAPRAPDNRPLEETVRCEVEWLRATSSIACPFRVFGERRDMAPEVGLYALRVVQEALANVVRYAQAASVRVGLVYADAYLDIIVEDDGCGFDIVDGRPPGGRGLAGLVARASHLGGSLRIDSTLGWGTRVQARLPYLLGPEDLGDSPRWRVVVAHDQPAMLAGLVRMLDVGEPGAQAVAEVTDAAALVDAVRLLRPHVVVASVRLPGLGAKSLVATVKDADASVAVVGMLDGSTTDAELRAWAADGVRGLLEKDADARSLGRAVVAAAQGEAVMGGSVLESLGGFAEDEPHLRLTPREAQVRGLVEEGLADKQIARRLGISVKTVEKHVSAVLRKDNARSRTELVARRSPAPPG